MIGQHFYDPPAPDASSDQVHTERRSTARFIRIIEQDRQPLERLAKWRAAQSSIVDHVAIAAELTGTDVSTIARLPLLTLAESALDGPVADLASTSSTPAQSTRPAVLLERLARTSTPRRHQARCLGDTLL